MLARLVQPARTLRALANIDAAAAYNVGAVCAPHCQTQLTSLGSCLQHSALFNSTTFPAQQGKPTDPVEEIPAMHPGMKRAVLGASNVRHVPIYNLDDLEIKPNHREAQGLRDNFALLAVRTARTSFDIVTGYKPDEVMTERHWLRRVLFLETVAGVPGMVAGMLRHLRSLRTMERDHGWIYTLLDEAENERMHLMTFLEVGKTGAFMRGLVGLGQGIMCNMFFLSYLLSPKTCHRFVGYLEEEAVKTYTHLLRDIDTEGSEVAYWNTRPAPQLAINYWQLLPDATMRDVVLVVRADEACHSHVNHTFGSMGLNERNPFRPDCAGPDGHEVPHSMEILKDVKDDFTKVSPLIDNKAAQSGRV